MEPYGSNPDTQSDPPSDLEPPTAETGLEEPMWQLGLRSESYPERPGEPDCIYYLRTGRCGYGDRCRFNHPPHRPPVLGGGGVGGGDYSERMGQPVCQHYVKTGTCKFGTSCKYHHPRLGAGSVSPFAPNFFGYPLRPGEKECSYYMKTGQCKFGMACKFHHPQPTNVQMPTESPTPVPSVAPPLVYPPGPVAAAPPPQPYGMVPGNWPVGRPSMVSGSYMQGPYGPLLLSPGVAPPPGWAPYPVMNPAMPPLPNPPVVGGPPYGMTQLPPSTPAFSGAYPIMSSSSPSAGPSSAIIPKEHPFPQRPGQPECQYYLKTGDCKFGMSCKYHHPAEWVVPETTSILSPMGLPLRPGTSTCSYYAQHGVCKFGPTCKFDHPMGTLSYSPSASSLSDMPVAPYPVGSSMGTLAPSSSSSDLRAEVLPVSNKDSPPISISLSSGSVGSMMSTTGSNSHQSGVQHSGPSPSPPSTTSSDTAGLSGSPS